MSVIAEAFAAYAQPLIDQTDGSAEQLNKAFALSQFCYNFALMPKDSRDQALGDMRESLDMDDEEFDEFWACIVVPMIRRHEEMFPRMHRRGSMAFPQSGTPPCGPSLRTSPAAARGEVYPGTDRYAPCPCNSGRKYKFCCGKKRL